VEAARNALKEGDFAGLTVAAITARAGMTRSAFYHYYAGLDELVMHLLEEFESGIRVATVPWLDGQLDESGDYRKVTVAVLTDMYRVYHEHRTVVRAAVQAAAVSRDVFDQWQSRAVDFYIDKTAAFIRRQNAIGRCRIDEPERIAKALILMNNTVGTDNMLRARPDSPADIARTVGTIWNAVLFPEPPA